MGAKKDPGKFTLRFNEADPQQKTVIDLLNRQGRYKAQFLVNAILHYIHCPETPDIYAGTMKNSASIEDIVKSVLAQQQSGAVQESPQMVQGFSADVIEQDSSFPGVPPRLEVSDQEAIFRTLNAFRPK